MDSARPFRAFVSYCHADAAFAARLQRRLEGYRLPKRLADRVVPLPGQASGRIGPIFRDRADLSAAEDLSAAVREAIAASSALVVVASPDAAGSRWVALEIKLFRELHPGGPVLVALARGEPEAALPEALQAEGIEPLAADFRREGDGKRLAFLKIVAGLTGIPFDALVQRDAQRQLRRVTAITLGALAMVLIMSALLVVARRAQAEAEHQRVEAEHRRADAEGLVEFMLTNLRDRLKGVGRLDVMQQVNARAMTYYASQGDLSQLPDDSLLRRARVLHAMGEDADDQGHLQAALGDFVEAHRVTAQLLAQNSNDTGRIVAHAQSEFWLGSAAWKADDFATARRHFEQYAKLSERLIAANPRNKDWQMEAGDAASNLGSLALNDERRPDLAQADFEHAGAYFEDARRIAPDDVVVLRALADNHAWLADSLYHQNAFDRAYAERLAQRALLDRLAAADPNNAQYVRDQVGSSIGIARVAIMLGRRGEAITRLNWAKAAIDALVTRDPGNKALARQQAAVTLRLVSLLNAGPRRSPQVRLMVRSAIQSCATAGALAGKPEERLLCEQLHIRESGLSTH